MELRTQSIRRADIDIESLLVPPELQVTPLGTSFETAMLALAELPRLHIELDGSFVWVSSDSDSAVWQVDGNLYDRDNSLVAIEIKGSCGPSQLRKLFDIFRSDGGELMVELVRDAIFVSERDLIALLS